MAKIIHNLLNSVVELGGGLRLQPRGCAGCFTDITEEQALSAPVQAMSARKKIRVMSLEQHAQFLHASGKTVKTAKPKVEKKPEPEPKPEPKPEPQHSNFPHLTY